MTNSANNDREILLDFEGLPPESLSLSSEAINQAVQLSNQIINSEQQWQTYVHGLALSAFESWLNFRVPQMPVNSNECSIKQPPYANMIKGVFNLEVGEFKVCLIATGSLDDTVISIPRAVVDLPEYIAHFYVLVNVKEEQEEAYIDAFISYDQLIEQKQLDNLEPQLDWSYDVPWDWFNSEPDNLLLYLRCLEPTAIALPVSSTNRVINRNQIQEQLQSLIPQLQSGRTSLWQLIDWETAVPILSDGELLNWLYQAQTGQISLTQRASLTEQLAQTGRRLTQEVINVGSWLQNEMDELAQNLAWNLLPAPTFALSSLRLLRGTQPQSPTEEMEMIIAQLRDSGMNIPVEARGAYQDFTFSGNPLRLYAVTWAIESEDMPEWSLLVVLGSQPEHQLPANLRLQLKEDETILDEQVVEPNSVDGYLYSRVIGSYQEQFSLTIIGESGESLNLAPFSFIPES